MAKIYDLPRLRRRLNAQMEHQWDLLRDLPWQQGVDYVRMLLPVEVKLLGGEANAEEQRHASWAMGLLAAAAIAEHEKVMLSLKEECWRHYVLRADTPPELLLLGEQFFKEEDKHAAAFTKYIETFAQGLNLDVEELQSVLPHYPRGSWWAKLYRLDALIGGRALWWAVSMTEEESMSLYRIIKGHGDAIDPLFRDLNRLHFEEEMRHSSYANLMLSLPPKGLLAHLANWWSYPLARLLQGMWVLQQLRRFSGVRALRMKHPFYGTVAVLVDRFCARPLLQKLRILINEGSYVSLMLFPQLPFRSKIIRRGQSHTETPRLKVVPDAT